MTDEPVVPVPADLELEERLVGPVTFRMASWLAGSAAGAVLLGVGGRSAGRLVVGGPLLLLGLVGAFWRPGGRAAPSWLRPMTDYLHRRRAGRAAPRQPADNETDTHIDTGSHADTDTHAGTSRPVVALAALLLILVGFAGGRLARDHRPGPDPATPAPAPAPAPAVPAPVPVQTPADPWSDCGC